MSRAKKILELPFFRFIICAGRTAGSGTSDRCRGGRRRDCDSRRGPREETHYVEGCQSELRPLRSGAEDVPKPGWCLRYECGDAGAQSVPSLGCPK